MNYLTNEQKQEEIFRISNELDSGKFMNDLSNEVEAIYRKYNIDVEHQKKKVEKIYNSKLNNISLISKMKENSFKNNVIIIRDLLIIIIIVSVLKIPFIGVETLLFSIFKDTINDNIYTIIYYIIEFFYIIFAVFLFIRMFKKRFKGDNNKEL